MWKLRTLELLAIDFLAATGRQVLLTNHLRILYKLLLIILISPYFPISIPPLIPI